jgi:hypothetical protein
LSIADFGLVTRFQTIGSQATHMLHNKMESPDSPQNFDFLLAAVYVPKIESVVDQSFLFSLLAYRQGAGTALPTLPN